MDQLQHAKTNKFSSTFGCFTTHDFALSKSWGVSHSPTMPASFGSMCNVPFNSKELKNKFQAAPDRLITFLNTLSPLASATENVLSNKCTAKSRVESKYVEVLEGDRDEVMVTKSGHTREDLDVVEEDISSLASHAVDRKRRRSNKKLESSNQSNVSSKFSASPFQHACEIDDSAYASNLKGDVTEKKIDTNLDLDAVANLMNEVPDLKKYIMKQRSESPQQRSVK